MRLRTYSRVIGESSTNKTSAYCSANILIKPTLFRQKTIGTRLCY